MSAKIDFIPDLFNASLVHVINESEEAGTISPRPEGYEATNLEGRKYISMDRAGALRFLLTGKVRSEPRQSNTNQLRLF